MSRSCWVERLGPVRLGGEHRRRSGTAARQGEYVTVRDEYRAVRRHVSICRTGPMSRSPTERSRHQSVTSNACAMARGRDDRAARTGSLAKSSLPPRTSYLPRSAHRSAFSDARNASIARFVVLPVATRASSGRCRAIGAGRTVTAHRRASQSQASRGRVPTSSTPAQDRRHPLRLRRPHREQQPPDQDSGGDGPADLPRVVRRLPVSRARGRAAGGFGVGPDSAGWEVAHARRCRRS